jgi:hypothetical protein
MRKFLSIALALLTVAWSASPSWAHHGWSSYDAKQVLKFEAELREVRYRNPHAEVEIDRDGERWLVILAPISRMEARGLSSNDLQAGRTITIEGYPRSDGTREIRAERIIVDGKSVELR